MPRRSLSEAIDEIVAHAIETMDDCPEIQLPPENSIGEVTLMENLAVAIRGVFEERRK